MEEIREFFNRIDLQTYCLLGFLLFICFVLLTDLFARLWYLHFKKRE